MKLNKTKFITIAGCYGDLHIDDKGYFCIIHLSKTFGWKFHYDLSNTLTISAIVHNGIENESNPLFMDFSITEEKLAELLVKLNNLPNDVSTILRK